MTTLTQVSTSPVDEVLADTPKNRQLMELTQKIKELVQKVVELKKRADQYVNLILANPQNTILIRHVTFLGWNEKQKEQVWLKYGHLASEGEKPWKDYHETLLKIDKDRKSYLGQCKNIGTQLATLPYEVHAEEEFQTCGRMKGILDYHIFWHGGGSTILYNLEEIKKYTENNTGNCVIL